jgi:TPR repeat protein
MTRQFIHELIHASVSERGYGLQGYGQAHESYGICFDRGDGVAMDTALAVAYYKRAADQGFGRAQYIYGLVAAFRVTSP